MLCLHALADQVINLLVRCKRFIIETIGGRASLHAFTPNINTQEKSFDEVRGLPQLTHILINLHEKGTYII